jgi:hypothetical protein
MWNDRTWTGFIPASRRCKAAWTAPRFTPEILFALWLYATLEGVGAARAIARLTQAHDACRWICGGVQVNHHTLSNFRALNGDWFDDFHPQPGQPYGGRGGQAASGGAGRHAGTRLKPERAVSGGKRGSKPLWTGFPSWRKSSSARVSLEPRRAPPPAMPTRARRKSGLIRMRPRRATVPP